jgi:soluble lytic murein transglycosylase-like protein
MSQATNYEPHPTRASRFAWADCVRDVRDGAAAAVRLVVTLSGCTALLAVAAVLSNQDARSQLVELIPTSLPFIATAEAQSSAMPVEEVAVEQPAARPVANDPRQKHVAQYLARRYRVAEEAVRMLVANAYEIGREKQLDPLLILSVIAIESSLNPFAASSMGAQGLMQVMTRVHAERFIEHGGDIAALDPIANMKVGSEILRELIGRGGSIERGLQLYVGAGNLPDDGGYGAKVLGERSRLQLAATGRVDAALTAARSPSPAPETKPAPSESNLQTVRLGEALQAPAQATTRRDHNS